MHRMEGGFIRSLLYLLWMLFEPPRAQRLYQAGLGHERLGEVEQAKTCYRRAAAYFPAFAAARARRALRYLGDPLQPDQPAPVSFGTRSTAEIAFCIDVLLTDGLQVSPFTYHADGDGSLRAAGMDADNWRGWLGEVVCRLEEFTTQIETRLHEAELGKPFNTALWEGATSPPLAWADPPAVSALLSPLWIAYQRSHRSTQPVRSPRDNGLWKRVQPLLANLRFVQVYPVSYPATVYYVIPPRTIILGSPSGWPDGPEQEDAIVQAMRDLAALAP